MDKNQERARCESIYYNLLECHRRSGDQNVLATAYLREFWETRRCDSFHDFAPLRNDIENRLGSGVLQRIITCDETDKDLLLATQSCFHYHRWHEKHLVSALTWSDWLKYQTIDRGERTLAVVGIFGAGYGGMKFVYNSFKVIRENIRKK
jgi:hypothetical protein